MQYHLKFEGLAPKRTKGNTCKFEYSFVYTEMQNKEHLCISLPTSVALCCLAQVVAHPQLFFGIDFEFSVAEIT